MALLLVGLMPHGGRPSHGCVLKSVTAAVFLLSSYSAMSCEQKSRFVLLDLAAKLGKTRHMGKNPTTKSLIVPDGIWDRKTSKE